jgi:hypothetical protein
VLVGQLVDADLGGEGLAELLVPLVVLGHEALVVDVDLAADGGDGHVYFSWFSVVPVTGSCRPSTCGSGVGMGRPGSSTFQ